MRACRTKKHVTIGSPVGTCPECGRPAASPSSNLCGDALLGRKCKQATQGWDVRIMQAKGQRVLRVEAADETSAKEAAVIALGTREFVVLKAEPVKAQEGGT